MIKLEELIFSSHSAYMSQNARQTVYTYEEVKEIAIAYAKLCLEKAAEHAVVFLPTHYGLHGTHNVDKQSITNIELP